MHNERHLMRFAILGKRKNPCSSLSGHFEPVQAGSLTRDWKAKTLIAADPQDYSRAPGLRGPHQIPIGLIAFVIILLGLPKKFIGASYVAQWSRICLPMQET